MDFQKLNDILNAGSVFALFGHINPDGDAIGAAIALGRALRARGKAVTIFSQDGVPDFFRFITGPGDVIADKTTDAASLPAFDTVVFLDCATKKRAGEGFFPIIDAAPVTASVDHHGTNHLFATLNVIDGNASSTCEILFRFFTEHGWEITREMASPLYLGVMYDTGRFIHSNTTPAVFRICSDLVALGADPASIANNVYNKRSQAHLRMLGHALATMRTAADGRIVWAVAPRTIFRELGADDPDTEGIVEVLGGYAGCEAHIYFTEGPDGMSRVSSRSTGRINVSDVCKQFGGGGHDFAAGARVNRPLDHVVAEFIAAVEKKVNEL